MSGTRRPSASRVAVIRSAGLSASRRRHRWKPWALLSLRSLAFAAAAAGCTTILGGCSTFSAEVRDFQRGWRTAEVVEIGTARTLQRSGRTDCRSAASAQQLSTSRFARVSYRSGGSRHNHVVLVDDEIEIRAGDVIYTNVFRCGSTIEIRSAHDLRLG